MTKTRLYSPAPTRFSLGWWLDTLRSVFFTALIAMLIWVYADMEFTEDRDFEATVIFTTKASARRTGMGLAINRSILAAHGGRVWAENRAEGGARVCFALPAAERSRGT